MLNVVRLEQEITKAFKEVFPTALETAFKQTLPEKTNDGDQKSKEFADTFTKLIAEDMGKRLANAIDYYIKNANIYGTIITMGGPFSQTAVIQSPSPVTNGKVPNSFGLM